MKFPELYDGEPQKPINDNVSTTEWCGVVMVFACMALAMMMLFINNGGLL
jgi:hypothetical protein